MPWLETGWTRRKIKIVENLTVSDYQMKLIIHKSGLGPDTYTDVYLGDHCRDDFADLRFTGPNQTTPLSYWIESITGIAPNLVATVWIKIPTLTPTNNIYIYYDNLTITSPASNGDNTFIFFDHFPGSSLDPTKWISGSFQTTVYGTGSVVVSNSIATVTGGLNTWWGMFANGAVFATPPFTVEFLYKGTSGTIAGVETTGTLNPAPKDYAGFEFASAGYGSCNDNTCNAEGTLSPASSYELLRIDVYAGGIKYYINRSLTYTKTTNVPNEGMKAFIAAAQTSNSTYTDWVFIHKYASPEPTFGISGTEELNITAINMTLNTNTCAGPCQIIAGVTWQNIGSSSITFTPAVLIDNTILAYGTDITISAGGTNSATITTPILLVGSHTICPYPN